MVEFTSEEFELKTPRQAGREQTRSMQHAQVIQCARHWLPNLQNKQFWLK